jgi:predicted dehydrogenase
MISIAPETVDVAIIGLGRMGLRHIEAVKKLGMRVCGLADISASAIETARKLCDLPPSACFTSGAEMLRSLRPTATVVATTAPGHRDFVLSAVAAGSRYIVCEKPMATSLVDADAMIAACQKVGAALAINHQMQFMPHYARVKALIGSEELGPLSSILVAGSNFGLAMNGSHYFEMFRYISGLKIRSVCAWLEKERLANPRGAQFQDNSGRLLASSAENVSMFIDFSANAGHGLQLDFICRHGQIVMDELSGDMRISARQPQFRNLPTARYGMPADVRNERLEPTDTVAPTAAVWEAMLADEPFPDGAVGLHAMTCCVAAHASHEAGGREIFLEDPAIDRSRNFEWA